MRSLRHTKPAEQETHHQCQGLLQPSAQVGDAE